MIVNDEARQNKMNRFKQIETKNDELQQKVNKSRSEEQYLLKTNKNVSGEQWGIPLACELFERKMKRLNPRFLFKEFSNQDMLPAIMRGWPVDQPWHHKRLCIETLEGLTQICLYPRHVLPEYTVMWGKDVALPNPEVISNPDRISKPHKDFGPNWTPQREVDWDNEPKDSALYQYFHIPYGTAIRGYREVLLICITAGYLDVSAVETEFGPANSAEWSMKVKGARVDDRPW